MQLLSPAVICNYTTNLNQTCRILNVTLHALLFTVMQQKVCIFALLVYPLDINKIWNVDKEEENIVVYLERKTFSSVTPIHQVLHNLLLFQTVIVRKFAITFLYIIFLEYQAWGRFYSLMSHSLSFILMTKLICEIVLSLEKKNFQYFC